MKYFFATLIALVSTAATAAEEHNVRWKAELQKQLGADCEIDVIDAIHELIGKDGFLVEGWVVESCKGKQRYMVTFFPPEHYPDKTNSHEVSLVQDTDRSKAL